MDDGERLDLKILGCHGGETRKHRTSSFLLNDHIAVDAGAITGNLSLDEQERIDTVLVSHAHLDHIRDLAFLADNRCQQGGPPLRVVGTAETLTDLRKHFFNDRIWPDFTKIDTVGGPTVVYQAIDLERPTRVGELEVTAVPMNHTIDTAGFIMESSRGVLAYSGDTGPTDRFWELLNQRNDVRGVLVEVSFPDDEAKLAEVSKHHTPSTLEADLKKLTLHEELPIFLFHIKPVFERQVEKELARIRKRNIQLLQLQDTFLL